jgi:hypothetical protein
MAGAAGHRPCGVLVLGRIECTTGPHWRGINGLAESPPVHAGGHLLTSGRTRP